MVNFIDISGYQMKTKDITTYITKYEGRLHRTHFIRSIIKVHIILPISSGFVHCWGYINVHDNAA